MLKDWNNHTTLPSSQLPVTTWFILIFSHFSQAFVTQSLIFPCHSFSLGYEIDGGSLSRVPMPHFVYYKSKGKF
jgi:hypothetical protein